MIWVGIINDAIIILRLTVTSWRTGFSIGLNSQLVPNIGTSVSSPCNVHALFKVLSYLAETKMDMGREPATRARNLVELK